MSDEISKKHAAAQQMLKASQDAYAIRVAHLSPEQANREFADTVSIDRATKQAGRNKVALNQDKVARIINGTVKLKPHETKAQRLNKVLSPDHKPSGMPKMRGA